MNSSMNIRQCYLVLELPMRAPLEEVKLSYKDLVQVWHPDRFTHSPRLQAKAANKLQLLNEAYDKLKDHLERQSVQGAYGYGTASYGTTGYSTASYGSTSYGAAPKTAHGTSSGAQNGASGTATAGNGPTARESAPHAGSKAASHSKMPSFFDSGSSYSWKWQLQATAVIFGFIGLMLLPIGLAVLIAEHPLLLLWLMPLPVMAYAYRVWVTR